MKCPHCQSLQHRVIDSRPRKDHIRRRRECLDCGHRWTTRELEEEHQTHGNDCPISTSK